MSSSQIKVAILDDYQNVASLHFEKVEASSGATITVFRDTLPPYSHPSTTQDAKDQLVERLLPFTIICTMRERTAFPAELLRKLSNLKVLATTGMRNASIDMQAASELGIVVTGTKNTGRSDEPKPTKKPVGPDSTTQHTWALILAIARGIARDDAAIKAGEWQTGDLATGLTGKTLAILGLGRLGLAVARIGAVAFGMRVIAWSSSLTQEAADEKAKAFGLPGEDEDGVKTFQAVTKEELFERADVLSVHYVLSDRSRGIVGQSDLQRMKPTSFLVNTSRGPLIDDHALFEILKAKKIRGAALDVFEIEPLPKDSVWRTTRWGEEGTAQVLLSPHMGYGEEETMNIWYGETAENVERWTRGDTLLNRIN